MMSQPSTTPVSCNGGSDGTVEVTYSGGVGPYTVDWGGYNPDALPAGEYTVEVLDANLCSQEESFLITEPAPFNLELSAVMPECSDPESGVITPDVNGGTGNVTLNWAGINPNGVPAGTYTAIATDEAGCTATATVVVPPAEIPESLELDGNTEVTQGDSAAYYYEFTLGSTYEWWYEGALEEQVLASFAISVLWDTTGFVCVQETNQEGCIGEPVCLDVFVQDDVWSVSDLDPMTGLSLFPNPVTDFLQVEVTPQLLGRPFQILDAVGKAVWTGAFEQSLHTVDVQALVPGQYFLVPDVGAPTTFQVQR